MSEYRLRPALLIVVNVLLLGMLYGISLSDSLGAGGPVIEWPQAVSTAATGDSDGLLTVLFMGQAYLLAVWAAFASRATPWRAVLATIVPCALFMASSYARQWKFDNDSWDFGVAYCMFWATILGVATAALMVARAFGLRLHRQPNINPDLPDGRRFQVSLSWMLQWIAAIALMQGLGPTVWSLGSKSVTRDPWLGHVIFALAIVGLVGGLGMAFSMSRVLSDRPPRVRRAFPLIGSALVVVFVYCPGRAFQPLKPFCLSICGLTFALWSLYYLRHNFVAQWRERDAGEVKPKPASSVDPWSEDGA